MKRVCVFCWMAMMSSYVKLPDGYDYIWYKLDKTQNTAQVSCNSNIMPKCYWGHWSILWQITGFVERDIQTCLELLELSQTENLIISQYLDTHSGVRQLWYLPLHCPCWCTLPIWSGTVYNRHCMALSQLRILRPNYTPSCTVKPNLWF